MSAINVLTLALRAFAAIQVLAESGHNISIDVQRDPSTTKPLAKKVLQAIETLTSFFLLHPKPGGEVITSTNGDVISNVTRNRVKRKPSNRG